MRRYYLHTRHNGVIYAELVSPEGLKLSARSTGTKNRDEALLKVAEWLKSGIPTGRVRKPRTLEAATGIKNILKIMRRSELNSDDALLIAEALRGRGLLDFSVVKAGPGKTDFIGFLKQFWDYDKSPYIQEKKAHGHTIGKNHCRECLNRVRSFYEGYFEGRSLNSINKQDLKGFSIFLTEKREKPEGHKGRFAERLSAAYINSILIVGSTALSWAFREGIIPADPTIGLMRFSGKPLKRGVLTPQEAERIFSMDWENKRAYAGNLLSCTTGLRAGEILALRKSDMGETVLHIRHSWSVTDGLKTPKNGEERKVPLLPQVREKLLELLNENPHKVEDPFIFYGLLKDKPMTQKILIKSLKAVCKDAGIDAKKRNIVFHSHRHFFAARMADLMTAEQITRITGHKTKAVFEGYADHVIDENLEVMAEAAAQSFGKILQFKKGA